MSKKQDQINIFNDNAVNLIDLITNEIDRKKKDKESGIKFLKTIRKRVIELQKSGSKLNKKSKRTNTYSGLHKPITISHELRSFIKDDNQVSRLDITRALCYYIHKKDNDKNERWYHLNDGSRDLQNPKNKYEIIPNKELSILLDYDNYCKQVKQGKITRYNKKEEKDEKVVNPRLTYAIIQKLIQHHFISVIEK